MRPLTVLLAAAGAGLAYVWYQGAAEAKKASDAARGAVVRQAASSLVQGSTYAVQLMVNPKDPSWGGVNTLETASALVLATMTQLGWKVLEAPSLRTTADAAPFLAGKPSEWIFVGTWARPEPTIAQKPGWLTQLLAYELPAVTA